MKIEVLNEKAYVITPYNADFIKAIKGIGGARWNREHSAWEIPANSIEQAREIMRNVYGEDDLPDTSPRVEVRLSFTKDVTACCEAVTIYGKTVARAYGRDSGARPGEDVAFVTGKPTSGGSMKNWTSVVPEGCVVILHNVPEVLLSQALPEGCTMERVNPIEINRAALEAERAKLLARLSEIDTLLA